MQMNIKYIEIKSLSLIFPHVTSLIRRKKYREETARERKNL